MAEQTDEHQRNLELQSVDDDALLAVARKRFQDSDDFDHEWRLEAEEALEQITGNQWDPIIKAQREREKRPCLTINRLIQHLHQVTNEQRQNRPGIKVSPVDDFGDLEKAKIRQGMIRHIEVSSDADIAYDTALEAAATHGRGWFRYLTEYEDPFSFNQIIKCVWVLDALSVYPDPHCESPVYADMNYCFIIGQMSKEAFCQQWPAADVTAWNAWSSRGDGWVTTSAVRVAEYWYKEYERGLIGQLEDGRVVPVGVVVEGARPSPQTVQTLDPATNPAGMAIVRVRETMVPVLKWCKINGHQVLERTDWPGQWIPIVPVMGEQRVVKGKIRRNGIVKHATDPQRMYNYWRTAETETIALAPKAPFIAAEGQIKGYEAQWRSANINNWSVLTYKPQDVNGHVLPPPQRNVYEPPVAAITQASMLAADDLKSTTGIYDAALGNRSNETSGRAINARKSESDIATFHYTDNLLRSLRHGARILLDLMPPIYDSARVARILGEDGTSETVPINQEAPNPKTGEVDDWNDMTVGKYDVTVSAGPSYATKRQEAVDSMTQMVQAVPDLFKIAGDLLVSNMDWPGADALAARLKKTLPPELQEHDEQDPAAQIEQMKQLIPQLQQQLEALNAFAQECEQQLGQLQQENQALKADENAKMAEIALKAKDLEATTRIKLAELELKRDEFDLEKLKLTWDERHRQKADEMQEEQMAAAGDEV